ncbi:MAG: hypothetical protein MMC33_009796 [Icmadophila ericetorum]|nr:hypothetical protein [Icmadophila ericetorum]
MACADPVETPSASAPDPPDESPSDESLNPNPASTTARENGGEAQSQDPNLAAAGIARQVCRAFLFRSYEFHALWSFGLPLKCCARYLGTEALANGAAQK